MAKIIGLRPAANIGEALATFADDILADARRALARTEVSDAVAVHDFRKAMKRWRSLLRLLEPIVGDEARTLRSAARDLARELALARDARAALDALADLAKADAPLPAATAVSMRARLESMREAAETTTLTPPLRRRIDTMLEAAAATFRQWPLEPTEFADIAAALAHAYGRARRAAPADWNEASAATLHDLRQRVVVHRYQMDLVAPLWPRFAKLWTGEAQRLRERLGTCQDLTVLASLTEARGPLARWRSRLTPMIRERQAAHVDAAARIARRLFAEKPKAFERRLQALWEAGE